MNVSYSGIRGIKTLACRTYADTRSFPVSQTRLVASSRLSRSSRKASYLFTWGSLCFLSSRCLRGRKKSWGKGGEITILTNFELNANHLKKATKKTTNDLSEYSKWNQKLFTKREPHQSSENVFNLSPLPSVKPPNIINSPKLSFPPLKFEICPTFKKSDHHQFVTELRPKLNKILKSQKSMSHHFFTIFCFPLGKQRKNCYVSEQAQPEKGIKLHPKRNQEPARIGRPRGLGRLFWHLYCGVSGVNSPSFKRPRVWKPRRLVVSPSSLVGEVPWDRALHSQELGVPSYLDGGFGPVWVPLCSGLSIWGGYFRPLVGGCQPELPSPRP